MLRRLLLLSSVLCLPVAPAAAEPLKPLVQELLQTHPRVKSADALLKSGRAGVKEARAGFLPKVDVSAAGGYARNDRTETQPPGSRTNMGTQSYNLTATQNLFDGYRSTAMLASANENVKVLENNVEFARQQMIFEGVSTYLDLLKQEELSRYASENQATLKRQLNLEDERVQRGSGIAVDVLQAKSRLQISRERYTAFQGSLRDAMARYMQVFGKAPQLDSMALPDVQKLQLPATLEQAIDIALKNNPQLKNAYHGEKITANGLKYAKGGLYPSVDLVAASRYDDNMNGLEGTETDNSVQVRASWQVFSGFADKSRIERATYETQSARESTLFTERKVTEEVKLAWSAMQTSMERANLLENAVNIAAEVYDARMKLRDVGSETALNVLDAENELYRARIDAAAARYDYYMAAYRLLLATGQLSLDSI